MKYRMRFNVKRFDMDTIRRALFLQLNRVPTLDEMADKLKENFAADCVRPVYDHRDDSTAFMFTWRQEPPQWVKDKIAAVFPPQLPMAVTA